MREFKGLNKMLYYFDRYTNNKYLIDNAVLNNLQNIICK